VPWRGSRRLVRSCRREEPTSGHSSAGTDELMALMGSGNTAYRAGDFAAAEQAFRRATVVHPRSAAAHNNLAQTLADLDRHGEALAEARVAVGLGGPLEDTSIRTLDAIVSRNGRASRNGNR